MGSATALIGMIDATRACFGWDACGCVISCGASGHLPVRWPRSPSAYRSDEPPLGGGSRFGSNKCQGESAYVGVEDPFLGFIWACQKVDFSDGVMTTSAWSKSIATALKLCFPGWFKGIFDHCLKA